MRGVERRGHLGDQRRSRAPARGGRRGEHRAQGRCPRRTAWRCRRARPPRRPRRPGSRWDGRGSQRVCDSRRMRSRKPRRRRARAPAPSARRRAPAAGRPREIPPHPAAPDQALEGVARDLVACGELRFDRHGIVWFLASGTMHRRVLRSKRRIRIHPGAGERLASRWRLRSPRSDHLPSEEDPGSCTRTSAS